MMDKNTNTAVTKATINLDTVEPDPLAPCDIIVPHTLPKSMKNGTFSEMFKNPTIHVTNAGIRTPQQVSTTNYSQDFTQVFATIDVPAPSVPPTPPSPATLTFILNPLNPPVSNLCINYVIYAERADKEYNSAGTQGDTSLQAQFVQEYTNEFLNPIAPHHVTTFNSVVSREKFKQQFSVDLKNPGH